MDNKWYTLLLDDNERQFNSSLDAKRFYYPREYQLAKGVCTLLYPYIYKADIRLYMDYLIQTEVHHKEYTQATTYNARIGGEWSISLLNLGCHNDKLYYYDDYGSDTPYWIYDVRKYSSAILSSDILHRICNKCVIPYDVQIRDFIYLKRDILDYECFILDNHTRGNNHYEKFSVVTKRTNKI